jgi:hypothetical protein
MLKLAIVINMPTRDRLADETKQLGKSYCNNGWHITMLMFVNSNYSSFACDVIAAMLEDDNKRFVISFFCL